MMTSLARTSAWFVNDVYYNGTYQEPTVKVYDRYNNRLTEGEDYTLSFSNNRQVGTATVFVTGINSYRGSYATEHFEILSNHSKPTNDRVYHRRFRFRWRPHFSVWHEYRAGWCG